MVWLCTMLQRGLAPSSIVNLFATMGGDRVFRPLRSRQLHDCVPDRTSDRRRVERVQQLLSGRRGLSLAEVAIGAGFSDQSQLCFHFKRIVGVTPGRFRASAKIT